MSDKRTKAFERMIAQKETYATLSRKLRDRGYIFNERTVYRYITGKETPSKPIKKAIAEVLKCLVVDIFKGMTMKRKRFKELKSKYKNGSITEEELCELALRSAKRELLVVISLSVVNLAMLVFYLCNLLNLF